MLRKGLQNINERPCWTPIKHNYEQILYNKTNIQSCNNVIVLDIFIEQTP